MGGWAEGGIRRWLMTYLELCRSHLDACGSSQLSRRVIFLKRRCSIEVTGVKGAQV